MVRHAAQLFGQGVLHLVPALIRLFVTNLVPTLSPERVHDKRKAQHCHTRAHMSQKQQARNTDSVTLDLMEISEIRDSGRRYLNNTYML